METRGFLVSSSESVVTFRGVEKRSFLLYSKKPSGGCTLARKECVAVATALGASVLQAERYFTIGNKKTGSKTSGQVLRRMGLEPTRDCSHKILSLARLPVPTPPRNIDILSNRTKNVK